MIKQLDSRFFSLFIVGIWLFLMFVLFGCGGDILCQIDSDCGDGQICVVRRCAIKIPTDKKKSPTKKDKLKVGLRKWGDTCDPRGYAWARDRCGVGLHCAILGVSRNNAVGTGAMLELDSA